MESDAASRRRLAEDAFSRAVEAADPSSAVRAAVRDLLAAEGPRSRRRLKVVGAGKAAVAMMRGLASGLSDARAEGWTGTVEGVVVVPESGGASGAKPAMESAGVRMMRGSHPLPDAGSAAAGRAILDILASADTEDLVVVLLSGGASALIALPAEGVAPTDLAGLTRLLLQSGATIAEMNLVRSHVSAVAGGRLSVVGRPGRTVVLVVSDVVGDDLSVIGSGPFYGEKGTFADAQEILRRLGVWDEAPPTVRRHLLAGAAGDTPEGPRPSDPRLAGVEHHIVRRNLDACRAMVRAVASHGYATLLVSHTLQGEAQWLGVAHAGLALGALADGVPLASPCALVTGGEATVTLRGAGRGGRNQETCLAAVPWLEGYPVTFLSAGTDGIDGNTSAAGGIVDGGSAGRARAAGVDVVRALAENDSGTALQAMGDALIVGPTGTNVADARLVLVGTPRADADVGYGGLRGGGVPTANRARG